jgi:ATP-dependent RNA helicase DOB1
VVPYSSSGGDGLYLVVDDKSNFRDNNFQKALSAMNATDTKQQKQKGKPQAGKKGVSDIYKITKMILERRYDPVIIFSFSKRDCEVC